MQPPEVKFRLHHSLHHSLGQGPTTTTTTTATTTTRAESGRAVPLGTPGPNSSASPGEGGVALHKRA